MTASEVRCIRCGSVFQLPVYTFVLGQIYASKRATEWLSEHDCRSREQGDA